MPKKKPTIKKRIRKSTIPRTLAAATSDGSQAEDSTQHTVKGPKAEEVTPQVGTAFVGQITNDFSYQDHIPEVQTHCYFVDGKIMSAEYREGYIAGKNKAFMTKKRDYVFYFIVFTLGVLGGVVL